MFNEVIVVLQMLLSPAVGNPTIASYDPSAGYGFRLSTSICFTLGLPSYEMTNVLFLIG